MFKEKKKIVKNIFQSKIKSSTQLSVFHHISTHTRALILEKSYFFSSIRIDEITTSVAAYDPLSISITKNMAYKSNSCENCQVVISSWTMYFFFPITLSILTVHYSITMLYEGIRVTFGFIMVYIYVALSIQIGFIYKMVSAKYSKCTTLIYDDCKQY